jgi:hypothetical protein
MRAAALCLLVGSAALAATTSTPPRLKPSRPASNAFDVYFHHDAVGRNMLSLVATRCGTERWPVKTATDYDRNKIHQRAVDSTIKYMDSRPAPSNKPQSTRIRPVEVTTYRVHARLVEYKQEADNDYHLVLRDASGRTMIAEIPAPSCVGRISPERNKIVAARRWFNQHYDATSDYKTAGQRVIVTGVGFFDYLHGQTGVAPNGIELHPVVAVRYP